MKIGIVYAAILSLVFCSLENSKSFAQEMGDRKSSIPSPSFEGGHIGSGNDGLYDTDRESCDHCPPAPIEAGPTFDVLTKLFDQAVEIPEGKKLPWNAPSPVDIEGNWKLILIRYHPDFTPFELNMTENRYLESGILNSNGSAALMLEIKNTPLMFVNDVQTQVQMLNIQGEYWVGDGPKLAMNFKNGRACFSMESGGGPSSVERLRFLNSECRYIDREQSKLLCGVRLEGDEYGWRDRRPWFHKIPLYLGYVRKKSTAK